MDDGGLFSCDALNCIAQVLFMVEANIGDGAHWCFNRGSRVQSATQAGFKYRKFNSCVTKSNEGNRSQMFKKRGQRFDVASAQKPIRSITYCCRAIGKVFACYLGSADLDAF